MADSITLNQAVILAGGKGQRLRPLTDNLPKPLVSVNGRPFLDYLLYSLVEAGFNRVLFLTGYKGEMIRDRYRDMSAGKIEVEFSQGEVEYQTGRRLLNAYELLDEYFMLLYADNYWPIEMKQMIRFYAEKNVKAMITVFSNKHNTGEYGKENNIAVDSNGLVSSYNKNKGCVELNGVDIGYFILHKSAIPKDLTGNPSFEQDILPIFISENQLAAYVTDRQYYYITNLKSLKDFESLVRKINIPALPLEYFSGSAKQ